MLPSSLTAGGKDGHIFVVAATQAGYAVNVAPEHFNSDGSRTFYSDQTLEIHENRGGTRNRTESDHWPVVPNQRGSGGSRRR